MKFKFIESNNDEVVVYAKEKNDLINKIEELVINNNEIDGININGYLEQDIVPLNIKDIVSIYSENEKTYVRLMDKTYLIKMRLYQIEECLASNFIRINKSRIINRNYILKFDLSWGGALLVVMKNSDKDYVSRRLMKSVKERMNIK